MDKVKKKKKNDKGPRCLYYFSIETGLILYGIMNILILSTVLYFYFKFKDENEEFA